MEALAPGSSFLIRRASPFPSASCAGICLLRDFSRPWRLRRPIRLREAVEASSYGGLVEPCRGSEPVEVLWVGSRKDAVIDFCLNSLPRSSSRLRFWTIQTRDSLASEVQLLQRCHGSGTILRDVEFLLSPRPPAIVLVASSGHGLDHITALELLDEVKSAGGLTVAILLKPFNFEGQRRLDEVEKLKIKLKDGSHFCIVIEMDSLLKREADTLAEALETANCAVFLALSTIPVMMSESHLKFQSAPDGQMKEIRPMEVVKLLQSNGAVKVGFGAGCDVKSSIKQAVYDCPFLCGGMKDLNGLVFVTFGGVSGMDKTDLHSAVNLFRQISECKSDIIVSIVQESHLESNLVTTTVLIAGSQNIASPKKGFLMSLTLHFPFLSSLIEKNFSQPKNDMKFSAPKPTMDSSSCLKNGTISKFDSTNSCIVDYDNQFLEEMESAVSRKEPSSDIKSEGISSDCSHEMEHEHEHVRNEQSSTWNIGPGFHIAQLWAKERASLQESNQKNEVGKVSVPIGVKPSGFCSGPFSDWIPENQDDVKNTTQSMNSEPIASIGALTDAGEAVVEIYNSAMTLIKGRNMNGPRNGGLLSVRAASMLEAERESQKNWTRILEIQYKGGNYKGRCQGGLPEGKGRLTFKDGSVYDGMWRNGKRCGLGTLYCDNGDVFQGSWRDDLIHGKGWFYFHSGDRWFANFWKGKANGEGRFYSKSGSIYFGNFRNGWRHGQSLYIDIDGSRWTEIWEEGVLVSRSQDSTTSG